MRASGRLHDQLRPVTLTRDFTCHAEGSVLVAGQVDGEWKPVLANSLGELSMDMACEE